MASVGTLLAIVAGVLPGSWFGRGIDVQPLRWVGDRSYGIYLWHWPVLVLVTAAIGLGVSGSVDEVPAWAGGLALALSLVAAAASYRFVETPLRRHGFRRALRAVRLRLGRGPRSRLAMLTGVLAGALALGGTTAAVASAPPMTTSEMTIRAGQRAMDAAPARRKQAPTHEAIMGADITAVGDSVMLASAPALYEKLPGIDVDAAVSRPIWAGPKIVGALASSGRLREHVVVALGTNGSVNATVLQKIADAVGRDRDLVLVNASGPRDWIPGVNRDLAAFADARSGVVVADWAGAIAPHEDLLAGDRIHPGMAGGRIFARVVEDGIRASEAERAGRAAPPDRVPTAP